MGNHQRENTERTDRMTQRAVNSTNRVGVTIGFFNAQALMSQALVATSPGTIYKGILTAATVAPVTSNVITHQLSTTVKYNPIPT